jgi:pyruvyl transferase EpsO
MARLKTELQAIAESFDHGSQFIYLDYPVHGNVGDLLINLGTEQFFRDYRVPIVQRYSVLDLPRKRVPGVSKETTFLCHGGGNFGDLYPKHQTTREWLVENYPQCHIVFLPQSVHYGSEIAGQEAIKKLARHEHCHIFVRDRESYLALKKGGVKHVSMAPDMAHQLWDVLEPTSSPEIPEPMYFLRRDCEATAIPLDLRFGLGVTGVDWRDILGFSNKASGAIVYYFLSLFARFNSPSGNVALWYAVRDRMIHDAVEYFSRYQEICTNRLHAMILGLLLKRDVQCFDNSYGKLTRYFDAWLTLPHADVNPPPPQIGKEES